MPSRKFDTETTGAGGLVGGSGGQDWNDMIAYFRDWTDLTWTAGAITLPSPAPDGKFRVTGYTGAQNLTTINGFSDGAVIELSADTVGAGGALTIVDNGTTIRCARGIDIVLSSALEIAIFRVMGTAIVGFKPYEL